MVMGDGFSLARGHLSHCAPITGRAWSRRFLLLFLDDAVCHDGSFADAQAGRPASGAFPAASRAPDDDLRLVVYNLVT